LTDRTPPTTDISPFAAPRERNDALIEKIQDYWASRGFVVTVRAAPLRDPSSMSTTWMIKSDLVNGMPPGLKGNWYERTA
jgi:hypothetical protein